MNNRVKEIRKHFNLTQTDLAERVGLTKNYISLIENGNRTLSDHAIRDICEAYRINENWLRTGQGKMIQDTSKKSTLITVVANIMSKSCNPINVKEVQQKAFIEAICNCTDEQINAIAQICLQIADGIDLSEAIDNKNYENNGD